jgi:predicted nucleic acid-binding protein
MKLVLDSNVAFQWVVTEPLSDKADAIRLDFQNGIHELIGPDVFPVEVSHALTRAERQGRVPVGNAKHLLADILTTPPQFHPYFSLLGRAVDISSQLRIGVYDCLYVALVEREQCEFVAADHRLVANVQKKFPFVVHLSAI